MNSAQFYYLLRRGIISGGGSSFTGLLDTYSGAAAAYSLRQLSSTYSGDAIVVRRASDNTTQSIGFVNNELDTTTLESFCSGTDGFVTTWYDQSGNGNDATNATAAEQPKIVSSGSTILDNGKAAVLSAPIPTLNLLRATFTLSQPLTMIAVVKTTLDRDQTAISSQNTTLRAYRRFSSSDNFLIQGGSNVFAGSEIFTQSLEFTIYNGANGIFSLNGSVVTSANFGTNGLDNLDFFQSNGALASFETYMQEVIVFASDQSSNRTGIETNINDHYSIY